MPRIGRRNPRESKPIFLVWLGLALVRLGGILPEATEMAAMQHLQRQALLSLQGRTRSVRARTLRAKSVVPNAGPAQRRNTVPRRGNAECCAPCESHAVRHRIGSIQREFPDSVPIRLAQTPTIYSMRQPWRRNAVRRRIDKGSGQFLTVLKSGGGLKSLRKLNSEEGWVNGKHIQRGSC